MFYQWNRKKAWAATGAVTDWDDTMPSGATWEAENDPSPDGWRVPTKEEFDKLADATKVEFERTTENGVIGGRFTDKTTGKSIFIPAAGFRLNGNLLGQQINAYCWSSTNYIVEEEAYCFTFDATSSYTHGDPYHLGFSVRPVKK